MKMNRILTALAALALSLTALAQQPLVLKEQMPNAVNFLPAPPDTASAAFLYDKAQYRWGLEQRKDSLRLRHRRNRRRMEHRQHMPHLQRGAWASPSVRRPRQPSTRCSASV